MPGWIDLHETLVKQFDEDSSKIAALNKELTDLRGAFLKYKELSAQHAAMEERFRVLVGILANVLDRRQIEDLDVKPGVAITNPLQERKNTPLWKVIREFTRQVVEIRIVELELELKTYGYPVSRQAIESAIDTHKDVFRSVRKGRERFVSLK
jgi:hypothetical protein